MINNDINMSILFFSLNNLIKNTLIIFAKLKINPNIIILKLLKNKILKDLFKGNNAGTSFSFILNNSSKISLIFLKDFYGFK